MNVDPATLAIGKFWTFVGIEGVVGMPLAQRRRRRNDFFSFHYDNLMRVNVVQLSGQFMTERSASGRSIEGFYDRGLWENAKSDGPERIKRLIREGLERTSVVCVLTGTQTHARRWVRYEIARSVVDGKGLVTIHLNGIPNIRLPHGTKSRGPIQRHVGIARQDDGRLRLCEHDVSLKKWVWYGDYTRAVDCPAYLEPPKGNEVVALNVGTRAYDWAGQNGYQNVSGWIDLAAADVGR